MLTHSGSALIALGMGLPRPINALAEHIENKLLAALLFLGSDLLRVCIVVGVVMLITGAIRNRRWKKQAEEAENTAAPRASLRRGANEQAS